MACGCSGGAVSTSTYARVRWLVDGTEYDSLQEAREAARRTGSSVQRLFS